MYIDDPVNPTKRANIEDHNALPRLATGLSSSPVSLPSSSMVLNQNPCKFDEGSRIKYGDPPKHGVIKWIGIISGRDKTLYAGVEMVMYITVHLCIYVIYRVSKMYVHMYK